MAQGRAHSPAERARFIELLSETANVSASAAAIGASRRCVYEWRATDEAFKAMWDEAIEVATDALEAEARRRAYYGTDEYITSKDGLVRDEHGQPVMQKRYSDTLLIRLLTAYRRDRFGDKSQVDLNVSQDLAALIEEGRRRARGE